MARTARWSAFVRRMSVFYGMFFIVVLVFLYYYYRSIPNNEAEFNERAGRALQRMTANILSKSEDLNTAFNEGDVRRLDFKTGTGAYEKLFNNTSYEIIKTDSTKSKPYIYKEDAWKIGYPDKDSNYSASVPVESFAFPVFNARTDIFDTYVLLKPVTQSDGETKWEIIYKHTLITSSPQLNIDTLQGLLKNSDLSAIADINISGNTWRLFHRQFKFHDTTLAIGGLINKRSYLHYVRDIGVTVIVVLAIISVLVLIVLPLVKIHYLSPNETIGSSDVIANTLAIFMGTSALLIIIVYFYLHSISQDAYTRRMHAIGDQVRDELESEIRSASALFPRYTQLYDSITKSKKATLSEKRDSIFFTADLPNLRAVYWVNDDGHVEDSWSALKSEAPLQNVKNYEFFKLLNRNEADTIQSVVVYPGKSSTTGELYTYIAKKGNPTVVFALSPDCSNYPVLPPGFGYALVDAQGEVLIHSDSRRMLSENMFDETRENKVLLNALTYKDSMTIKNVVLYGDEHDLVVKPLSSQPLSLVVLFNKWKLISNISRLLHFTIICLLILYGTLFGCVLAMTMARKKVSKLKFALNKIQWVRPSEENKHSYRFTNRYFTWLAAISAAAFIIIQLFNLDIRLLLYISLLIPVYTILAFVLARTALAPQRMESRKKAVKKIKPASEDILGQPKLSWGLVFLINLIVLAGTSLSPWGKLILIMLQLIWIFLLVNIYIDEREKNAGQIQTNANHELAYRYRFSLYMALILISVLPTFGIITYAFYAEKIQYKKAKQLHVAEEYLQRRNYQHNNLPLYKPFVQGYVKGHNSLYKGIYLSDRDSIKTNAPIKNYRSLADEPYSDLLTGLYTRTGTMFGVLPRKNLSADPDTTWIFANTGRSIALTHKIPGELASSITVSSSYRNPLENFWSRFYMAGIVLCLSLGLFLVIGILLVRATMNKFFLVDLFSDTMDNSKKVVNKINDISRDETYKPKNAVDTLPEDYFIKNGQYAEDNDEQILDTSRWLAEAYEKIWHEQVPKEKFILFDLSRDGYTNYKNADVIYGLIRKGILISSSLQLKFFSLSFRNFVLEKKDEPEMQEIIEQYDTGGVWQTIRNPLLMGVFAVMLFILVSRNDMSQYVTTFIAAATALIPLLLQVLAPKKEAKKEEGGGEAKEK